MTYQWKVPPTESEMAIGVLSAARVLAKVARDNVAMGFPTMAGHFARQSAGAALTALNHFEMATRDADAVDDQQEEDCSPSPCTNPGGHKWEYTGTAYGGDDPRWCGEGRCLCVYCGADGDA